MVDVLHSNEVYYIPFRSSDKKNTAPSWYNFRALALLASDVRTASFRARACSLFDVGCKLPTKTIIWYFAASIAKGTNVCVQREVRFKSLRAANVILLYGMQALLIICSVWCIYCNSFTNLLPFIYVCCRATHRALFL